MSKKKKIIISSVVVGVVLLSIILTVILVNIKRFDISAQNRFMFNNHTKMEVISIDDKYTPYGDVRNNGVQTIHTSTDYKYGLFSYVENKVIVDTKYDQINHLNTSLNSEKTYFQLIDGANSSKIQVVDEHGKNLKFLDYNESDNQTYSYIKSRTIEFDEKKGKVRLDIDKKYHDEKIIVSDISFIEEKYFNDDLYYEIWGLTTSDGITYENLYRIKKGKRELLQTINNEIGNSVECKDLELEFLTNGTPLFIGFNSTYFESTVNSLEYIVYDINFNEKGRSEPISVELLFSHLSNSFRIGNYNFMQFLIPTDESKFDYSVTTNSGIEYYNVRTYKLNIKNCKFDQVNFDYVVNGVVDISNLETTLINASLIKNKKLEASQNLLINDRLQTKEISYQFNTLKQINDDCYLAIYESTTQDKYYLIDDKYNLIANLENFENIFATSNAIIMQDTNYQYVCNLEGIIIKKYPINSITNISHEKYYLRQETVFENGENVQKFYLEQLGLSKDLPLIEYSETNKYKMNNEEFENINIVLLDGATLIVGCKLNASNYDYYFYNIEGNLLHTQTNLTTSNLSPTKFYSNDNNVVISFGGTAYLLDR